MSVFLRADSVTLELPLDVQRVAEGERASGFKAALGGSSRTYRDVLKNISFSAEEGEITPTLKLKRRVVEKNFAAELEKLYTE